MTKTTEIHPAADNTLHRGHYLRCGDALRPCALLSAVRADGRVKVMLLDTPYPGLDVSWQRAQLVVEG